MKAKKKLGEIFLENGKLTSAQLQEALEDQKRYGGKLGTILLERRFIQEKDFFAALTRQLHIPAVDFSRSTIPESVIKLLPRDLAEKYAVFPVALKNTPQGRVLVLAMSDPTNVEVQDEVRFTTGYRVEPALALEATIRYALREYYYQNNGKGSYRMKEDLSIAPAQNEVPDSAPVTIERIRSSQPEDPQLMTKPPEREIDLGQTSEDKPQLSRELKALLKLLAKKGILSSKEYLEIFKETK